MKRTGMQQKGRARNFPVSAVAIVSAAIAGIWLGGCRAAESETPHGMPPPEVSIVVVQPRDLPATFEYVGQIAGVREVEVRPRVSGILERWNYKEGAPVKAGDTAHRPWWSGLS